MSKKIIIIGGGAAGLAAGVKLASVGHEIELFESRSFLGGRVYSFVEPVTGDIVDNGQHLMAGFYYETFKLLKMLKTSHLVKKQTKMEIEFLEKGSKTYFFKCPRIPMPLGFVWGLTRYSKFPRSDILKLVKTKKRVSAGLTAAEWLNELGISGNGIDFFFKPLILATLNADVEKISAAVFQMMLKTIFQAKSSDAVLAFPREGLSKIFAEPAADFITDNGGKIYASTQIKEILVDRKKVVGVVDINGHMHKADAYISALPPDNLYNILPEGRNHYLLDWNYSPIVAVNLWFDRPVMKRAMIGLLDSPFHWCFDKKRLFGTEKEHSYISFIISAADREADMAKDELIDSAVKEIGEYLKDAGGAKLKHAQVIKEKKATVLITPETISLRERVLSPWPNLFIAGDWTDTGLPATIESAVKSGFTAAEMFYASTGSA